MRECVGEHLCMQIYIEDAPLQHVWVFLRFCVCVCVTRRSTAVAAAKASATSPNCETEIYVRTM